MALSLSRRCSFLAVLFQGCLLSVARGTRSLVALRATLSSHLQLDILPTVHKATAGLEEDAEEIYTHLRRQRVAAASTILVLGALVCIWQKIYEGRPLSIAKRLPHHVRLMIPSVFHHIVDVPHLCMVGGFLLGGYLLLNECLALYSMECLDDYCYKELFGLCWFGPSTVCVYGYVCSYDDAEGSRQKEAARKRAEIREMYEQVLNSTEDKLKAAAESNAGLAEASMNEFRRDFVRFLTWLSKRDEDDPILVTDDTKMFVWLWLGVFEETVLDPVDSPRQGGDEPFVDILGTFGSDDMTMGRRATLVERVLTTHAAKTVPMKTAAQKLSERLQREKVGFIAEEEEQLEKERESLCQRTGEVQKSPVAKLAGSFKTSMSCRAWRCEAGGPDTFYPCKFKGGFFEMTVHNRGHCALLQVMLFGPALIAVYILDGMARRAHGEHVQYVWVQMRIFMFWACLCVVSWHFERIDKLMQIEKEIQEIEDLQDELVQQRVRIQESFEKTQVTVEIWLHRTIPLLELFNELQQRTKDVYKDRSPSEAALAMTRVCAFVQAFKERTGPVCDWFSAASLAQPKSEGDIPGEKKEPQLPTLLGSWIKKKLELHGDLDDLLDRSEQALDDVKLDLKVAET
eukprot:TRINITY_DN3385_c0_g1_i1.p1 TRINITY_DN3385_c0_g1~~TRINITY_DN3385_c0_g1_i1.p1  ORF type:complete len:653 (+),score=112.46 TRINITY_DN3385_c0_g1_i1:78-1961(+)